MQNYQKRLDEIIAGIDPFAPPRLLLHGCCAPCSSYVLEYLTQHFSITLLFYNPNISPSDEYEKRLTEIKRLINELPVKNPVSFENGEYDSQKFFDIAKGFEKAPEGGERCFRCYELRLREAAQAAKQGGFDYFTTTLSISPHKNAEKLNEIGEKLATEYGVKYLYSDFKKKNGYKRSIELSREYDLYRQNYCGCVFSKLNSELAVKAESDTI